MAKTHQDESISRTLLLPRELHLGTFRLRHVLAEDGCKESQVALAKSLLTSLYDNPEERTYNVHLAVYWLLEAAKRGQEEAFLLLKTCLSAGVGISTINSFEIEKCLKFNEVEKISRRVASSLFHEIMSDTEETIPEDIFREKIDLIFKEDNGDKLWAKANVDPPAQPQQLPQKSSNVSPLKTTDVCSQKTTDACPQKTPSEMSLRDQAHVSFSEVVNSVQSCLEGNVPLVSLTQMAHYAEYRSWMPTKYISIMCNLTLKSAQDLFQNLSSPLLPLAILFLCLLMQVTSSFFPSGSDTSNFINKVSFMMVVFLCLLAMVSWTCYVIHINFGGSNVKKWLSLIKFFEPNIKSDEIEKKYLSKTAFSLVSFLIISLIYIVLIPLSSIPMISTDIGILSFVLMVYVDRTITHQRYYVNISLALNLLTCLCKTNLLQNLFSNSLSFLNFTISYEIIENVHMHLSFISCLSLPFVLPYLYVKMIRRKSRGWHLVLLPHLMSVTWMNLACVHLANTTTTNQLFSLFSWLVFLILSNFIGTVFTLVLYTLLKISLILGSLQIEIFFLAFAFIIIYPISLLFVKKFKVTNESKLWTIVICLAIMILSYQVAKPPDSTTKDVSGTVLPWEKYESFCHLRASYRTNTAEVQIACLPFKGREISMEGTITDINVIKVHNNMELVANMLPNPLKSWFTCAFGKSYASCDSETPFDIDRCKLYATHNLDQYHLHNWNKYNFRITLELSSRFSPEVVLFADHGCSDFVKNLKEGNVLQVIGVLESNIGGSIPQFTVKQASCKGCYVSPSCNAVSPQPLPDYRLCMKNVMWLYFAPFIQYEPK